MRQIIALLGFLFVITLGFIMNVSEAVAADFISHAPDSARVYISEPVDGQTVPETFTVKFGLSGMGVAPAGVDVENTGHHHLLVDVEGLPDLTTSLPKSDRLRHYGGGQTETELSLPPGNHTLQLVLGNSLHIPHDHPVISEKVRVLVRES